jgi:acetate kinase
MIAVLKGVNMVVFTGGIDENDEVVRAMICEGLAWSGMGRRKALAGPRETAQGDKVCVLPSQEDEQIARHTWSLQNALDG